MKLIVGLGNPGNDYAKTRHNVGFMLLDNYLGDVNWKKKFNGMYYDTIVNGEKVVFLKPLTFMNLSGDSVVEFVNYYNIDTDDVLVIQDDLDLPFLKFRLKYRSSSGGHNGIKSIINRLGTDAIPRLKIGIAHDRSIDTKDYVLGSLSKKELDDFSSNCNNYIEIIDTFIDKGIDECMAKYNIR